jgi:DNA-binding CsgD family transcriptional regulator
VLSPRQLDCLRLAAKGMTARGTAAVLGISPDTVRNHLEEIRGRLDAATIAEAVSEGYQRGLLEINKAA